jgi:hypothetical protein
LFISENWNLGTIDVDIGRDKARHISGILRIPNIIKIITNYISKKINNHIQGSFDYNGFRISGSMRPISRAFRVGIALLNAAKN